MRSKWLDFAIVVLGTYFLIKYWVALAAAQGAVDSILK